MLKEKRPKQPPQQPEPACDPLHSLLPLPFAIIPSRIILCKSKHFVQIVNVVRPSTHTSNNNNKHNLDYNNKNCGNKGFRLLHAF